MADSDALKLLGSIKKLYNKTIDVVFAVILFFITVTMVIGVARLFYRVGGLLREGGITGDYLYIFTDVLTLFILIELSRSLFDYFSSHRILLVPIIDAGVVFVLRHIMIDLFNHKLETESIYALSVLLLALGAIRIVATMKLQTGKKAIRQRNSEGPQTSK